MLNTICVAFFLVGMQSSIEDKILCENGSQLEACNCSTSYLPNIKLHLRCLIGFYSECASESCSVWHYEDTSHCQLQPHSRLLAVFKNPFLIKTKVKVGQTNCWTKLTNNIVIDSLYNIQSKQIFSPNNYYIAQLVLQLLCFRLVI